MFAKESLRNYIFCPFLLVMQIKVVCILNGCRGHVFLCIIHYSCNVLCQRNVGRQLCHSVGSGYNAILNNNARRNGIQIICNCIINTG